MDSRTDLDSFIEFKNLKTAKSCFFIFLFVVEVLGDGAVAAAILEHKRFFRLTDKEKILDKYGKYIIEVKSVGSGLTTVSVAKFRDLLKLALRHKSKMQKKWVFHSFGFQKGAKAPFFVPR